MTSSIGFTIRVSAFRSLPVPVGGSLDARRAAPDGGVVMGRSRDSSKSALTCAQMVIGGIRRTPASAAKGSYLQMCRVRSGSSVTIVPKQRVPWRLTCVPSGRTSGVGGIQVRRWARNSRRVPISWPLRRREPGLRPSLLHDGVHDLAAVTRMDLETPRQSTSCRRSTSSITMSSSPTLRGDRRRRCPRQRE